MKRYLAELLGTFFLAITVIFVRDPYAIGLMFMAMVYLFGGVSGGHFNPAVSLGFWLRGKVNTVTMLGYFLAQTIGAVLAALSLSALAAGQAMGLKVGAGSLVWFFGGAELLLTFVFAGVVLVLATTNKFAGNYANGIIMGLTLVAVASCFQLAFFNPAIAAGAEIADVINGVSATSIEALVVHVLLPFAGAALAAWKVKCMYNNN